MILWLGARTLDICLQRRLVKEAKGKGTFLCSGRLSDGKLF